MQTALLLQIPANLKKLYIAYSGGIDSSVLLHVLHQTFSEQFQLIVWHIHHGLQDNADETERFACEQAQLYGLEYRVDYLNMDASAANIEARARSLRYELFARALGAEDALLTAHHQNDQAETVLLNLMRGSGSAGLSGIARAKPLGQGMLLRPLLDYSRAQLENYAAENRLKWIDDPSNADDRFDRNYLRHEVLPQLIRRWPAAVSQIQRVSKWQQESEELHQVLAELDFNSVAVGRPFSEPECLSLEKLTVISSARQKNLIRFWIKKQRLAALGFQKMNSLLQQLSARKDAMPCIDGAGYSLRCYHGDLYLVMNTVKVDLQPLYDFDRLDQLHIDTLALHISRAEVLQKLNRTDSGQRLQLRFRVDDKASVEFTHSHRLKRLFQQYRIPPWIRYKIPQILLDGELAGLLL